MLWSCSRQTTTGLAAAVCSPDPAGWLPSSLQRQTYTSHRAPSTLRSVSIVHTAPNKLTIFVLISGLCLTLWTLYINNVKLQYVDSYKYLGMYIHVHNDDLDILRQLRSVILRSNILLRTFHRCSTDVKLCLFQSYCANMYCSHLWFNFTKRRMNRLRVSYNNSMRRLFNLHYRCSASAMFVYGNISSFGELRRKYI